MSVKFCIVFMSAALLFPFPMFAESSQPDAQKTVDTKADLLNAALEVVRATTAPRVSVPTESVRQPPAVLAPVVPAQPTTGGQSTVVVYHRPGYIAPPTGRHHGRNFGPTQIIKQKPKNK